MSLKRERPSAASDSDVQLLLDALERIRDSLPDDNCSELRDMTKELSAAFADSSDALTERLSRIDASLEEIAHSLKRMADKYCGDEL
jgi:ElaB/YqjD/DUF883 family membrane-anchored ribosome-binding protein